MRGRGKLRSWLLAPAAPKLRVVSKETGFDLKCLNSSLVTPANCLYVSLSLCRAAELSQLICIGIWNERRVHEQASDDTESHNQHDRGNLHPS